MFARPIQLAVGALLLATLTIQPMPHAVHAQDDAPPEPQPLVMLFGYGSRSPILELVTPNFALYDDGTIIYCNEYVDPLATEEPLTQRVNFDYRSLQLDEDALSAFLATLPLDEFQALDAERYVAVEQPAEPRSRLAVWVESKLKTVWVYGDLRHDEDGRAKAPAAYMTLYDTLLAFVQADHPDAENWLPDHLEIGLIEGETGFEGLTWPSDWPTLDDSTTIALDDGWIVILDPSEYPAALVFIDQSMGMTTLDGKRYEVVLYLPFPNEATWIEAVVF